MPSPCAFEDATAISPGDGQPGYNATRRSAWRDSSDVARRSWRFRANAFFSGVEKTIRFTRWGAIARPLLSMLSFRPAWRPRFHFVRLALWFCAAWLGAAASVGQVDLDKWTWRNPSPLSNSLQSVVWSGTRFVAVGARGAIVSSVDGVVWSARASDARSDLSGIAWNGTLFVAVGFDGAVVTSPDSTTWTVQSSGGTSRLRAVVWAQNQFVAVGANQTDSSLIPVILTSPDGRTWTSRDVGGGTGELYGVAWSGREFLAAGEGGPPLASADGVTWTKRGIIGRSSTNLRWAGNQFVAIEQGAVFTSPDGLTWTQRYTVTNHRLSSLVWNGSKYIAVGLGGLVASSVDGSTWTNGSSGGFGALNDVAWDGRQFVAVGIYGGIFTSPDGLQWTQRNTGIRVGLAALLVLPEQIMAVGEASGIVTSVDGASWRYMPSSIYGVRGITRGDGRLVVVGDAGRIATSTDGVVWTPQNSTTGDPLYAAVHGAGQYIALGARGTVRTSRDGTSWNEAQLGATGTIRGAAFNGVRFVAVGDDGIFTTEDGATWVRRFTTNRQLNAIVWNGSQFAAVGGSGAIVTSPDGLNWHEPPSDVTAWLSAVAWSGSEFVAVGTSGIIVSSNDGVIWRSRPNIVQLPLAAIAWTGTSFVAVGPQGTIVTAGEAPPGVLRILSQPEPQAVIAGEAASFAVTLFGTAEVRYQWRRDGTPLAGATRSTLNIASVQTTDAGNYDVVITSATSQVTSRPAALTIIPFSAPSIGTQPAAATIAIAGNATALSVTATGVPSPTYQWSRDGVPIPNATNASLGFMAIQPGDAGTYSVVVTNRLGAVTSTTATLSVERPPAADLSQWHWRNPLPTGHSLYQVASNDRGFVAVGAAGTIVTSADGVSWTLRASGTFKTLRGVTWTGNLFVAVGAAGTLLTSSDGKDWTPRAAASPAELLAVAASDRQIVAVGEGGTILSSTNGVAWTQRASPIATTLNGVTFGGGQFVAVGSPRAIFTSADGVTWTDRNYLAESPLLDVAWSGRIYVAVGRDGLVATSVDGVRWVQPFLSFTTHHLTSICWTGDRFLAVAEAGMFGISPNRIFSSPDGLTWTAVGNMGALLGVTSSGGRHVAVGWDGTILHSADTQNWSNSRISVRDDTLLSLATNGSLIVAAGGFSNSPLLTSLDGKTWTPHTAGPTTPRQALVWGRDTFVGLSGSGKIVTSPDGVAWTEQNAGGSSQCVGLAWTGLHFIAASREGTVRTSPDAITWTAQPMRFGQLTGLKSGGDLVVAFASPDTWLSRDGLVWRRHDGPRFDELAWNGELYVGVGGNAEGHIVTSKDAVTWQRRESGTTAYLHSIASNGRQFVAAGMSGTILSSVDGETWTQHRGDTPTTFRAVTWAADQFIVVGDRGWILTAGSSRLTNLSVRSLAGADANALVVGFVVAGGASKTLLARGIGPALASFGVTGAAQDPVLTLFAGATSLATNDDWSTAANATQIAAAAATLGAFPLAGGSRDAVLLQALRSGSYTTRISSKGSEGVALAEVYDASVGEPARLVNVSALTRAGTGPAVLIAGFVIAGDSPKRVLLRAIGPSLASFGVTGALADPQLAVFQQGAASPLQRNDDWGGTTELAAAFAATGAFTLPVGSRDAALLLTLAPGVYTAQVSGIGTTTGTALVEVYEVP